VSVLPETLFADPVWHTLHTDHRHFAINAGQACRFPAEVAPFVAVAEPGTDAFRDLASLLVPGESVWLNAAEPPVSVDLLSLETLPCYQMVIMPDVPAPAPDPSDLKPDSAHADSTGIGTERSAANIGPLTCANAPEMVALTDVAFPGFFRRRTCEMGSYYGIRRDGELIAMGGERMRIGDATELSGLCTHPAHRGHAYGIDILWNVVSSHRAKGEISFLHASAANAAAVNLYLRLGWTIDRTINLHRLTLR
jgi:GNAT superfamily N-acetyltransferase